MPYSRGLADLAPLTENREARHNGLNSLAGMPHGNQIAIDEITVRPDYKLAFRLSL